MHSSRVRALSCAAGVLLLVGAVGAEGLAGPGKKGKKKRPCPAFAPGVEDAQEAETLKVTRKATEKKPLAIEFEHGPAAPEVATESLYFNLQVQPKAKQTGLYLRLEFDDQSDVDLYLYDESGEEAAVSGAFNPAPIPGATDAGGNGGPGFESIPGHAAARCEGFSVESRAYLTQGTPAVLKAWLGKPAPAEEEG